MQDNSLKLLLLETEARASRRSKSSIIKSRTKLRLAKSLEEMYSSSDTYSSDNVMGPSYFPTVNPPYCIYPPLNPSPPSTTIPTPILPLQSPPPPPPTYYSPPLVTPNPPEFSPGPPGINPSPPLLVPSPPAPVPGPPVYEPSPPSYVPSPPQFVPGPPVFLPPIVYPPPLAPPPSPPTGTLPGLWCVAKPTVPEPIIQEAMDYACGSGADCKSIQPNGSCFQPDTLLAHASYAFNSYWQRTKVAGGTCDFGGTAMLITTDPSKLQYHVVK